MGDKVEIRITIPDGSDNVVVFPKPHKMIKPQSLEEVNVKILENRLTYAMDLADMMMQSLSNALQVEAGVDLEELYNSGCLLEDSLRSVIMQSMGLQHPLQQVADSFYGDDEVEDEDEESDIVEEDLKEQE